MPGHQSRRIGTPRSDRKFFSARIPSVEKWKTDAASAASARPRPKTSAKWSGVPAPPDAITGMLTAALTPRCQVAIEAGAGAVAIDRRQQDLARAARFDFARPIDGIAALGGRAATAEDLVGGRRCLSAIDLRPQSSSLRFASMATTTAWLP